MFTSVIYMLFTKKMSEINVTLVFPLTEEIG